MTLIQKIEQISLNYGSDSKRSIAEFVLRKQERLCEYTTSQVAAETYTSKSALVRFAQTLGFGGWKEFVQQLVEELHYQQTHYSGIDPNFPFRESSTTADIIHQMSELQIESIRDTADQLNPHMLEQAAELLAKADRIALFGISPNNILGELFRRRMLAIGRQVEMPFLGDSGLLASSLGKNDCAILISYSGNVENREPLNVLRFLIPSGVKVIGVTSSGDNVLRDKASYTFTISSREKLYNKISTFATEVSINYILDTLFAAYFARNYAFNVLQKIQNGRVLERERLAGQAETENAPAEPCEG